MSTPDQSKGSRSRDEVLAGEYVLGVLSLDERRKVEQRMRSDRQFAAIVGRWEQNLLLTEEHEMVMASPFLPKSEKRALLGGRPSFGFWNSILVWRTVAIVCAIAVFAAIAYRADTFVRISPQGPLLADLSNKDGAFDIAANFDAASGRLTLSPVATGAPEQKSLQVWLIHDKQPPISLGILPQTGGGTLQVPVSMTSRIATGDTLAVSVEPFGGSPTGQPTGTVVVSGQTRAH